jgi:hypothetical protein
MHGWLDEFLVCVVLLASVGYAVLSLGPRTLRGRLLAGTSALLRLLPPSLSLHAFAERLEAAASIQAKGSCGGCDNCGPEQSPAPRPPGSEVRISVAKIGKRR